MNSEHPAHIWALRHPICAAIMRNTGIWPDADLTVAPDCAAFTLRTPSGSTITVTVNIAASMVVGRLQHQHGTLTDHMRFTDGTIGSFTHHACMTVAHMLGEDLGRADNDSDPAAVDNAQAAAAELLMRLLTPLMGGLSPLDSFGTADLPNVDGEELAELVVAVQPWLRQHCPDPCDVILRELRLDGPIDG